MSVRRAKPGLRPPRRLSVYLFLGLVGAASGWALLEHVLAKNRILDLGHRQHAAEQEISALEREIRDLNLGVEEALSRKALMGRLAASRTRLRPIQPGAIILIPASREPKP